MLTAAALRSDRPLLAAAHPDRARAPTAAITGAPLARCATVTAILALPRARVVRGDIRQLRVFDQRRTIVMDPRYQRR